MMRVAASIPLGPIRFKTFLADARNRYVVNIVATMAAETATKDTNSNFECFTSEVIPRTVAMPPGPSMIGIAKGVNATSSTFSVGLLATMDAPR